MSGNLTNSRQRIKKLVFVALFVALAYASTMIIHPKVLFLTFDVKDSIITLAAMIFGPVSGVVISFVVSLIELVTISETGLYGFIMNFLSSSVFALVSSLIYKYKKTLAGGIIGLVTAMFSVTTVMLLANLVITPLFMSATTEDVVKMIPTILLPFNFLKALANAGLVIGFYKPLSNALKSVGVVKQKENETLKFDKITIILFAVAVIVSATAVTVMFQVIN